MILEFSAGLTYNLSGLYVNKNAENKLQAVQPKLTTVLAEL